MEHMRGRYRAEVLGWDPIAPARRFPWRKLTAAVAIVALVILTRFVFALRDRAVAGLPGEPSPWHTIREADPAVVLDRLQADARGVAAVIAELDSLERQMREVHAAFVRGERTYYAQEDQDAIHRQLLTYLNLRTALLRTVWTYRGAHDDPSVGPLRAARFCSPTRPPRRSSRRPR